MQHALTEILDDPDAQASSLNPFAPPLNFSHLSSPLPPDVQVIFEPYDDDFSNDGVVEIECLIQHHPDIIHELTDALAGMGLDVFKADVTHSKQVKHGHTALDDNASVHAKRPTPARKLVRTLSRDRMPNKGIEAAPSAAEAELMQEAHDRVYEHAAAADAVEFFAIEEKERAVFYAREADGTHQFSTARRHEIKAGLERIVHEHGLHGTVVLRVVHESEMRLAHMVPKFDHEDMVQLIKCTGAHHMELLHEIFDMLHEAKFDVVHAEMDETPTGQEEHVLYVARTGNQPTDRAMRSELRGKINELYKSHGKANYSVSVLPLRGETEESVLESVSTGVPGRFDNSKPAGISPKLNITLGGGSPDAPTSPGTPPSPGTDPAFALSHPL